MADAANYEYKCVAGPTVIAVKKPEDKIQAVVVCQKIMNREAVA